MLPRLGNESILDRSSLVGFIFEPKYYGIRVFLYKDEDNFQIINRRGEDILYRYPEFLEIPNNIRANSCVIDAVITVPSGKNPDIKLLQKREQARTKTIINKKSHENPAKLFVIDLIERDGEVLMNKPLRDRKLELHGIMIPSQFVEEMPWTANARAMWRQAQEQELEGMMAKEGNSKYEQNTRSWHWLKIKRIKTINAVVIGYEKSGKEYPESFILALYHPNKIWPVYAGSVYISDKIILKTMNNTAGKLITEKPLLSDEDQAKIKERFSNVLWIRPEIIVKLKYDEFTQDFQLKNSSFISIRFDKKLDDCTIENI